MNPPGSFFDAEQCPCGNGRRFALCCQPVLASGAAPTAEALMRSRYTAYVRGDEAHLLRSWHPASRPPSVDVEGPDWSGLEIIDVVGGASGDARGVVEFEARFELDGRQRVLRERSLFVFEDRWFYVGPEDASIT